MFAMERMSPELWERIPAEAQAIFLEMAETIVDLQHRVKELEARLGMTPQNSSLPPSSQHPHAKPKPRSKPSGRKRGGQRGHKKHQRTLVPPEDVTETVTLKRVLPASVQNWFPAVGWGQILVTCGNKQLSGG